MVRSPTAFTEAASFNPFNGTSGVRVATTSTTIGGDLLVSGVTSKIGVSSKETTVQVLKYQLARPSADAVMLDAKPLGQVVSAPGSVPDVLGGD